jgi:hypothetical protein
MPGIFIFSSKNPDWEVPFVRCCVCLKILKNFRWDSFNETDKAFCTDECYKLYKGYCHITEEPDTIY